MAIDAIYYSKPACKNGPRYKFLPPRTSLQTIRDKKEHAKRRKAWDPGFGARGKRKPTTLNIISSHIALAFGDYEPMIANYADQFFAQIHVTVNTPIDVTDWFNFYGFDVVGDLAFGKSFNILKDGVRHYFM